MSVNPHVKIQFEINLEPISIHHLSQMTILVRNNHLKIIKKMPQPLKLKIELKDMPHKVIRKVLVPEDISLHQLHLIIQDSMGWEHAHLYEFVDAKFRPDISVGIKSEMDEEFNMFGKTKKQNAFKTKLRDVFLHENGAKPFWYWYDFGDDWWHRISFLKTSKKDLNTFKETPICVAATGSCPPEDCGGPWGYAEFLEAIKDEDHPEREEMMEWYGLDPEDSYDETLVNLEEINVMLKNLHGSKQWKSKKPGSLF